MFVSLKSICISVYYAHQGYILIKFYNKNTALITSANKEQREKNTHIFFMDFIWLVYAL